MSKTALLDGDILTYRVGFSSQDIPLSLCLARLNKVIENICRETNADRYNIYLTGQGKENFRFAIDPLYKANRTGSKPIHYLPIREYLQERHGAVMAFKIEADDLLGINQNESTVICTIDKDLDQIPGEHYNFVKKLSYTVTEQQGLHWFFSQMLIGDTSDNIKGVVGMGPARTLAHLPLVSTSRRRAFKTYLEKIIELYKQQYDVSFWEKVCINGALLKIKRSESEPIWHPKDYLSDLDWKKLLQKYSIENPFPLATKEQP